MIATGQKRSRDTPELADQYPPLDSPPAPRQSAPATSHANSTSVTTFRNVSACNRCRVRKNRCDQNLPACQACDKAGVKCVGYDPITKREIPRTYVYYLESRVKYLEDLLDGNHIQFEPCTEFDLGSKIIEDQSSVGGASSPRSDRQTVMKRERSYTATGSDDRIEKEENQAARENIDNLVSNIGLVSVQGASDSRFLGSTSGISFARVVAAAIKSAVPDKRSARSKPGSMVAAPVATSTTSFRDSFFGLSCKPDIEPAPFPDKDLGSKLVELYFEHANPQIPILHRGDFMHLFNRAYQSKDRQRSARELYMLNIVFAIGAGIIIDDSRGRTTMSNDHQLKQEPTSPTFKKQKVSGHQRQPEEYHASAMIHLETFLGSTPTVDRPEGYGGGLEQLQAVLLLASFALLRPVAPGLWYITGVAVRLGVDLGLHYEDGAVIDEVTGEPQPSVTGDANPNAQGIDPQERGRREWIRDLRRRLWWCVYSFDRLVSTCVGRPFGITDQVITTDWPSLLDDKDITTDGFLVPSHNFSGPSYKRVAHHYFRLRLLQSEILQVLQYRQTHRVHSKGRERSNQFMHTALSSSFLKPFDDSFHAWRKDIDRRLWEWKESAPLQQDTTVRFNIRFLELNYWQAVIMLYRQSLSVPARFAGVRAPHCEVESPISPNVEDHESDDEIYLKVAEAGQRVLKLYKQLHKAHVVNYTYLATVHLFMAGIAFLYSVWHSSIVRSRLNIHDVNYTVMAGTTVLTDLIDKCPPAEACRDAFERMSKATIAMCQSTTGFGSQVKFNRESLDESQPFAQEPAFKIPQSRRVSRPPPEFDYNLKDLFPDQPLQSTPTFRSGWQFPAKQVPAYGYSSPTLSNTTSSSFATSSSAQASHQFDPRLLDQQSSIQTPNSTIHSSTATSTAPTSNFEFDPKIDLSAMPDFEFLNQGGTDADLTSLGPYSNLGFEGAQPEFDDGTSGMPDLFNGFFFGGPLADNTDIDMTGLGFPVDTQVENGMTTTGANESSGDWRQQPLT